MAHVTESKKACAVNPLKMSAPLGASYAFMGLESCMPLMHGSQGCTSFGVVLLVRHFKEAIPLQTSAMNEATTIMGGYDNLSQALLNIRSRAKPALIGICSTGLTETKGDDVEGYIRLARQQYPELADTEIVYVSTPDYIGAFQDGWAKAVTALVGTVPQQRVPANLRQVNVLPGSHLTPGDIEELREIIESFGLEPAFVPDVSGSLDGHIPDQWLGTTIGGTPWPPARLGGAALTLAIGEQMRPRPRRCRRAAACPSCCSTASPAWVPAMRWSGNWPPCPAAKCRPSCAASAASWWTPCSTATSTSATSRWPGRRARPAVGGRQLLTEMGAELAVAVTTTRSPLLERLPVGEVLIGDLEDFEHLAQAAGCDLLMTHSHGRQAAQRLGKPLFSIGIPMFDRVGNAHICHVGYRGTRNFVYEVGNLLMDQIGHHHPHDWPLPAASRRCGGPGRFSDSPTAPPPDRFAAASA
jgi:nitrogenase molybdenum-iron protein NifN